MKSFFLSILVCCLSFPVFAAKDPVVATVNGEKIYKSVFDKAYKENLLFVSNKPVTKEKVLNDLINRKIGIKRAKDNKLDSNQIVRRKMEDIMYHAQISQDLEPELKKITVKDEDVRNYYKENPEYRTANILFRVRAQPEKEETEAALTQCLKVYKALKSQPSKFAELANKFSQTSTAPNGGDLGFQPAASLAPEYFQAIKGKKVDEIVPCIRTQFGYHIAKILAVKDFKAINTELYKKIVYDTKRDKILQDYFSGLRKSAKVQVNKQFLK